MTDDGDDDDDDDDIHFLLSEKVKVGCVAKIYAVEFEISQFIAHNSRKSAIREQLASHVCISACTRHAYKCCTVSLSLSLPPCCETSCISKPFWTRLARRSMNKVRFSFLLLLCGARAWALPVHQAL